MNLSIESNTETLDHTESAPAFSPLHRTTITVRIGACTLHVAGQGTSAAESQRAAEQAWQAAAADMDQLNGIRRRTGHLDWAALEGKR
jgi:hypothetical protein